MSKKKKKMTENEKGISRWHIQNSEEGKRGKREVKDE